MRTENVRSPLGRVTPIPNSEVPFLQRYKIYEANDHLDNENNADMDHELSEGLSKNLSETDPGPTTESEIDEKRMIMEEQRAMVNNAIQPYTQLWVQNAKRRIANRECCRVSVSPEAMATKMFNTTYLDPYCGIATVLDRCINCVHSNFKSRARLFLDGDPDTIQYVVSFLSTWNYHPDPAQR